jgi:hypothetical protein
VCCMGDGLAFACLVARAGPGGEVHGNSSRRGRKGRTATRAAPAASASGTVPLEVQGAFEGFGAPLDSHAADPTPSGSAGKHEEAGVRSVFEDRVARASVTSTVLRVPERPSLSTRKAGLLVSAGETKMFADDALVITPAPGPPGGDIVMQYRISGYTGAAFPPLEWQDARLETWRGETQWCFTLPRGRMSVEARAVSTSTGAHSQPSSAKGFLVRGRARCVCVRADLVPAKGVRVQVQQGCCGGRCGCLYFCLLLVCS